MAFAQRTWGHNPAPEVDEGLRSLSDGVSSGLLITLSGRVWYLDEVWTQTIAHEEGLCWYMRAVFWPVVAGDLNGRSGGHWDPAAHRAHRVESSRPKVDNLSRGPHQSSGNTINKSDSVGGGIPDIGTIH